MRTRIEVIHVRLTAKAAKGRKERFKVIKDDDNFLYNYSATN